jgi:hypothetical protein
MAKIINAFDDPEFQALAILTIRMDDGEEIARKVLKIEVDTLKKTQDYLTSLEEAKKNPIPPSPSVDDLTFLKGTESP